jgi:hypothetical protein
VPPTVRIDHNLAWNRGGGNIAFMVEAGSKAWSAYRLVTGFDAHGVNADPRFVDIAARDYRLTGASPAIDRGATVAGVTDGHLGSGPDLGRYEAR